MAKKKTERSEIKVTCLGNNAVGVTGSMILIETLNKNILLECGMVQNAGNPLDDFKINSKPFPFKAKDIDIVFLNHAHIDHSGLLPKLINHGFSGKIITSYITSELLKPMLNDSAKIIRGDAKALSKQRKKEVLPIYEEEDVIETLNHTYVYNIGKVYSIDKDISFKFINNSHIIGATQLELYIETKSGTKTILYTSDLGDFKIKNHYVKINDKCRKANLVISECTYGKRSQESAPNREKDIEKLYTIIRETCVEKGGRILIPVFSLARAQEILTTLYEMYKDDKHFNIPVVVDSPLLLEINKVYHRVLEDEDLELFNNVCNWKNVKFIKSVEESQASVRDKSPKICLSSSGFLIKGRSCEYLKEFITNENDCIISVGYAPDTSTFGKIKNKVPYIKIDKKNYKNLCSCMCLNSFSSHIPRHSLLSYLKSIYTDKYLLVHAEEESKKEFKEDLEKHMSEICSTSNVVASTLGTIARL